MYDRTTRRKNLEETLRIVAYGSHDEKLSLFVELQTYVLNRQELTFADLKCLHHLTEYVLNNVGTEQKGA